MTIKFNQSSSIESETYVASRHYKIEQISKPHCTPGRCTSTTPPYTHIIVSYVNCLIDVKVCKSRITPHCPLSLSLIPYIRTLLSVRRAPLQSSLASLIPFTRPYRLPMSLTHVARHYRSSTQSTALKGSLIFTTFQPRSLLSSSHLNSKPPQHLPRRVSWFSTWPTQKVFP